MVGGSGFLEFLLKPYCVQLTQSQLVVRILSTGSTLEILNPEKFRNMADGKLHQGYPSLLLPSPQQGPFQMAKREKKSQLWELQREKLLIPEGNGSAWGLLQHTQTPLGRGCWGVLPSAPHPALGAGTRR